MTGQPAVTLESVAFHWGDAYLLSYARDRWVALRRDRHRFLTAHTLTRLKTAIEADYRDHPIPPDSGPPGADSYLNLPEQTPPRAPRPSSRPRHPPPAPRARPRPRPPTWFMLHPIQITCRHCGHTLTCDTSSQAAHDKTCGPCAHPLPDHPSGPAA